MSGTSLTGAVQVYREQVSARLHVPSHGGGPGNPALAGLWPDILSWDVTEQPELDDLSHPTGPIRAGQEAAAAFYNARRAYYLTGGATLGVQAAVLAALRAGGAVLAARDSHRCLLSAVAIRDADLVLVAPELDRMYGVSLGPRPDAVEAALVANPDVRAVFVTYPSYLGIAPDLQAIAAIAHRHGALVIADAAHGAHFGWHPALPEPALQLGADLVVAGMHKSGGSLTQTALLLAGEGTSYLDADLRMALGLLATSSPSYLLMVSIEQAVHSAQVHGGELLSPSIAKAQRVRGPGRVSVGRPQDPLRIALRFPSAESAHSTVNTLARTGLRGEYVEGSLALFIVPFGGAADLAPLGAAAEALVALPPPMGREPWPAQARVRPRQALFAGKEAVRLSEAIGRASADIVAEVPPGIPALWPGERFGQGVVEELARAIESGHRVRGIDQDRVWVVAE